VSRPLLPLEPVTAFVPSEDGVEVAVHDYGGSGRALVVVHGTGLCSRMWEPVLGRLPEGAFRALAVDLRGHGATRTPADVRYDDDRMVADLTAVCRFFDLRDACVAAHSMGGATSLLTEATRPGTFARLWVYEPIIFPRPAEGGEGPSAFAQLTRRRRAVFPSRQAAIERYRSRPPLDELDSEVLAAYVRHGFVDQADGSVRLACDPEQEARAYEQFLRDGWGRLGDVAAPVLVGYGGRSDDLAGTWAPRIAERLPAGTAARFEHCAHFGPFADLDVTARSITDWFL
jgi:pimeloyl-ACP methyl ester carboxylesterase